MPSLNFMHVAAMLSNAISDSLYSVIFMIYSVKNPDLEVRVHHRAH